VKTFEMMNHYDVLRISRRADAEQIERAYREALEIYGGDSLVTYSLFSDEQRGELLQSLDEAYETLIDPDKRRDYDRTMIASGVFAKGLPEPLPESPPSAKPTPRAVPVRHRDLHAWVKNKSQEEAIRPLIKNILSNERLSGRDLARLREALGIESGEIYEKTRISGSVLKMIEEDRYSELPADIFVRNFLKLYAEILQVDPPRVVEGYFKSKLAAGK
jgi:flagellar biosynthesis protein FlhG